MHGLWLVILVTEHEPKWIEYPCRVYFEVLVRSTKDVNASVNAPLDNCVGDALSDCILHFEV